jgi:hypothetical protein
MNPIRIRSPGGPTVREACAAPGVRAAPVAARAEVCRKVRRDALMDVLLEPERYANGLAAATRHEPKRTLPSVVAILPTLGVRS